MKILLADTILTMDSSNPIVRNGAVVFDERIVEITDDRKAIEAWKARALVIDGGKHSIALPGLINAHTHLEFSSNATELAYGTFIGWLHSMIEKREKLLGSLDRSKIDDALTLMLRGGTTSIGAISSYGFDLESLAEAKQRVVYFNELIGSNPAALDAIFASFQNRLDKSDEYRSDRFMPAIAIHSAYSVHPALLRKAIALAHTRKAPISAHFMESKAERRWLDSATGEFKPFFEKIFKLSAPFGNAQEFLRSFSRVKALFVHCAHASDEELDIMGKMGACIVHCPVSNRLLGCGLLSLERVKNREIAYLCATDGLSSNYALNLFGELRSALMMHEGLDLPLLARDLLRSVTDSAAKALGLNCGRIAVDYAADLLLFRLPSEVVDESMLYLHTILHAPSVMDRVFINGEAV
ncbi:MAG: metal-dependent hydrolase [Helicobacteraceae bacterium]|jgi:cytosine/adenosine deaminase-related metal-dependent hydrolase|nr:metal-dependent hydrolase [Helicobacteraceae bacterium]